MNAAGVGRIILYAHDVDAMVAFYAHHFGFRARTAFDEAMTELTPVEGGAVLLIQKAGASLTYGQSILELVFDVVDVDDFVKRATERGLVFSPVVQAEGYRYARTTDPNGNTISVSSRAFMPR
ncbi:VOC family protein [Rhizobium lemnae]|uniref:VOC family protein n=1 Tax=Rhizobium lemnae TaxID=1214924 RepID=A0ABV8E2U9_9HYPH|nr:VOC family protein [Rhizobium lemnae]MCJ8507231.1 VOC family protein [Rhizobium lemnae]